MGISLKTYFASLPLYVMITARSMYLIFALGLILLVISFLDNIVMQSFLDSLAERKSPINYLVFLSFICISVTSQSLILYLILKTNLSPGTRLTGRSVWVFQILAIISLCIITSILLYLAISINYQKSYDAHIFRSVVYASYAFSILNMVLLMKLLSTWSNRNIGIVLVLYILAFSSYLLNEIVSAAILNNQLEISSLKISYVISPWDNFSYIGSPYYDLYDITSLISFTGIWLATSMLLYHYSKKLGKLMFWILVGLPLIYYLVNWDLFRTSIIYYVMDTTPEILDPVLFVLGGVKQTGGFFFAISFIIISRHVRDQRLKLYLIISGTGMMLLIGSNQITLLQFIPYPPYSLTTVSMISISSFMLLIGLHYLAVSMAHDKQLLEFTRKIVNQKASRFLYDLGSSQWQKEMDSTLPFIMDKGDSNKEGISISTSLSEEEIRNYMNEISEEIRNLQSQDRQ
jgi:hypothetical protein